MTCLITNWAILALLLLPVCECYNPLAWSQKPFSQDFSDNQNLLKYTANSGPFSQGRGVGLNRDPPAGCRVDQVAMLSRHGERYPDSTSKKAQIAVLETLRGQSYNSTTYTGSLQFLNDWISYWDEGGQSWMRQETVAGPYSGMLDVAHRGALYRARYGNLWDQTSVIPIFTAGYQRVVDSGRLFGMGFFGYNYTTSAAVQIIPETTDQGVNNLSPWCPLDKDTNCVDQSKWTYSEISRAARRLNKENSLNLTHNNVLTLMEIAAFELNIRGSSPWLSVFTDEEWIAFEYYQSSKFYCYYGPGAPNIRQLALPYLNSTRYLLNMGPENSLPLVFSFTHDSNITPLTSVLNLTNSDNWDDYDPTEVTFHQQWKVADIVPQGAQLTIERLVCDEDFIGTRADDAYSQFPLAFQPQASDIKATYASNYTYPGLSNWTDISYGQENIFVRFVLNDAVLPLPTCNGGPGKSCKLSEYNKLVERAIAGVNYNEDCGSPEGAPEYVEFFWNWNNTNALNSLPEHVPINAGYLNWKGETIVYV